MSGEQPQYYNTHQFVDSGLGLRREFAGKPYGKCQGPGTPSENADFGWSQVVPWLEE